MLKYRKRSKAAIQYCFRETSAFRFVCIVSAVDELRMRSTEYDCIYDADSSGWLGVYLLELDISAALKLTIVVLRRHFMLG